MISFHICILCSENIKPGIKKFHREARFTYPEEKSNVSTCAKAWGRLLLEESARNLSTTLAKCRAEPNFSGKCFGHTHERIHTNAFAGVPRGCECRTCCTQPFRVRRCGTHNVAFSYSTVTQDITYHNAEINAADGA